MLKLQEKLFFRSGVRIILLSVLLIGELVYHLWIFRGIAREGMQTYGYTDYWTFQVNLFVYYFILILFLSYDYFREVPDAELLDIIKVSGRCINSDIAQVMVMFQWILLSAGIFAAFFLYGFYFADTLTMQIAFYVFRLVFIYVILNGLAAILLAWLLSRTVGKLLGYICVILFSCIISPIATMELGYFSMIFQGFHDMCKIFLIMPEGLDQWFPGTLLPVNLTIVSRIFFWIVFFSLGLVLISKNRHKKWLAPAMVLLLVGDFAYMYLPASFYSGNDSYGASDSQLYDQMTYMIEENVEGKKDGGFQIASYKMKLSLGRLMKNSVCLFLQDKNLPEYKMTLYHLYEVEKVTDQSGAALPYEREGDYLTVHNPSGSLESICIDYKGALASFYANAEMINLPGWFAYYPIPGYRPVYQDYEYVNNQLEEDVSFDISVDARAKVYSDLQRIEGNHFAGKSRGVTLVSGFYKETELENGITCIYPYLDKTCDPLAEAHREDKEYVLDYLGEMWEKEQGKTVIILPVVINGSVREYLQENSLVAAGAWGSLAYALKENGNLSGEELDAESGREEAVDLFITYYQLMKQTDSDEGIKYANLKREWDGLLENGGLNPSTDEEFEKFILEELGQEEYDMIMESK